MKWIKLFIYAAGAILLAAALIRFVIAAGDAPGLALPEPMLGIPIRYSVLAVGGLEAIVALICLFGKQAGFQIAWLAWLFTDFIAYRICLLATHCHPQATCIGCLTDPLHISRGTTGFIMALMPCCLLLGTCGAAVWLCLPGWTAQLVAGKPRGDGRRLPSKFKMFCPSCGGKIQFSSQNLGRKIPCPLCKTTLTLRTPENLKMSCSFCQEHVEFPVHAIGQKIRCPHCKMEITLKEPA